MGGCAVARCKSSTAKKIQHFRFPKNQIRKRKWERFCNRGDKFIATQNMLLCKVKLIYYLHYKRKL